MRGIDSARSQLPRGHIDLRGGGLVSLSSFFLVILLCVSPLFDFFTVLAREYGFLPFERLSLFCRMLMLLFACVIYLNSFRKEHFLLWGSFFLSNVMMWLYFFLISTVQLENVLESLLFLFKFFIFFIFVGAYKRQMELGLWSLERLVNLINYLIVIYCLSIVCGAIFGIEMFHNYESERWGVKGIIISGNEASGFLLISFAWSLLNKNNMVNKFQLGLVILAMFVCGTKAALLAFFIITFGWLLATKGRASVIYLSLFTILTAVILLTVYNVSGGVQDAVENTIIYFEYQFNHNVSGSLFSLALSGRDFKFINVYESLIENQPWSLIQGGFAVANYPVEMDIFDLIALNGVVGTVIYFVFWLKEWYLVGNKFKLIFILTYLLLGTLGGHFFYSAIASPFLAALCLRFNSITNTFDVKKL
jgi:hypothetical protein